MNKSGIAARNRNGHFGNPPPTAGISPQSQIVPSTLSCSKTCTSPWGCWGATSIPATSVGARASLLEGRDVDANRVSPSAGATGAVEDFDALVVVPETLGSCATAR